jgi:hypothetical protein
LSWFEPSYAHPSLECHRIPGQWAEEKLSETIHCSLISIV